MLGLKTKFTTRTTEKIEKFPKGRIFQNYNIKNKKQDKFKSTKIGVKEV